MMRGRRGAFASALLFAVLVPGCAGGDDPGRGESDGTGSTTAGPLGAITVMAPAPLASALQRATAAFERRDPGAKVVVNHGHIPALLAQISQGVPADVLVTPDEATMARARSAGVTRSDMVPVARNRLVLVTPATPSAAVTGITALGKAELTVAVCASELPCGRLAGQVAAKAGVALAADSLEPGGSPAVVTKAAAGEIDVGVCFATDAKAAAGKVKVIPLDDKLGAFVTVTAAAVTSPANARGAEAFLAFLASAEGRAAFTEAGFAPL